MRRTRIWDQAAYEPFSKSSCPTGKSLYCDQTGGDYYDFFPLDDFDTLAVVIGDFSGHGVASALLMAGVRAYLQALATRNDSAAATIIAVNRLLSADVGLTGQFMTLFFMVINLRNRQRSWVRTGHDPAWIYTSDNDRFVEIAARGCRWGWIRNGTIRNFGEGSIPDSHHHDDGWRLGSLQQGRRDVWQGSI